MDPEMVFQWSTPPGRHALVEFSPTLYQSCSMWWIEHGRSDRMSLMRLGYKRHCGFWLALSLISPSGVYQLPWLEAAMWGVFCQQSVRNWGFWQELHMSAILEADHIIQVKLSDDYILADTRLQPHETLTQNHTAKLLPGSWPSETMT